jgi:NADH-dependent peroxiredoxin subunit F
MLDADVLDQLKTVFSKLTGEVRLRVAHSDHAAQSELEEMLREVESTSDKIRVEWLSDVKTDAPWFEVIGSGAGVAGGSGESRIAFRGVPGGHEFSSFVLAILNGDGKGKLPDAGIASRIRALQGPVRLRTYVSLSCENCPEVVQALNVMATLHPDFQHETVDGAVAQDEVAALGIQGVPSVVHVVGTNGGELVHSGKSQLIDLLGMLEETFGKAPASDAATGAPVKRDLGAFDVVVIGGGPAGTSAAIYSARKGLKTAIVAERVGGQLRDTKGIENMISMTYTEGPKLAAQLAEHLAQYPVQVFEHRRVHHIGEPGTGEPGSGEASSALAGARHIQLESGETLDAKAVIVATGAKWRMLGIPGEKEHIGQGVAFCAHCDGPFYKGKKVAVVGGGNSGVEAAIDLANIASHVTLLEYGPKLKADTVLIDKIAALPNARVVLHGKSTRVVGDGKKVTGLEYQDTEKRELHTLDVDGVFVQIGLLPNSQCVKDLVELTPRGEIVIDAKGHTSAVGIYAAGDVTTVPFKQIVVAMGEGAKVALTAFEDRMHQKQ